jgi:dTDP-4-amino-4,6-dideoxygalactose transaminase
MTLHDALAIDGGAPVRTKPMPRWPAPGEEEIAAVTDVLRGGGLNYWTGSEGRGLEREYAEALGRRHGIAVANGTLALELALRAFEVGPGDEVVVPARTFIATASVVVAVGAVPVIADIEAESSCVTAATVASVLTERTRAVIPVHLGGWPVDMGPIVALAEQNGLVVIEDCAQAHGGARAGLPVGAMGGHAGAFSFCQDKILPTGEGGMLVLDDDDAYERAWDYKDHGKSLSKVSDPAFTGAGTSYKWLVDSFGTNWRMDEMSAAVGRVGLRKLSGWHEARTKNALRLAAGLADLPGVTIPLAPEGATNAFYRLYGLVEPERLAVGWDRDRILAAIAAEGVPCQYGSCAEIYREEAFARAGFGPADRLPVASDVHERSVAFFVHPTLTPDDIDDTIEAVRKVMAVAAS